MPSGAAPCLWSVVVFRVNAGANDPDWPATRGFSAVNSPVSCLMLRDHLKKWCQSGQLTPQFIIQPAKLFADNHSLENFG